jgi:hypothetical protein
MKTSRACPARGYITLLSVLIVGAIGTAIAVTLLTLGVSASRSQLTYLASQEARAAASACAEEALEQIKLNANYTGTGSLTLSSASCSYTVVGGTSTTTTATGTAGTVVRKVKVILKAVKPLLTPSSWQEVADF